MDTMSLSQWILAATVVVVAVSISIALAHTIQQDGFGRRPAVDPRSDWGTPTVPSLPYRSRL
jgi:hypothetical protein